MQKRLLIKQFFPIAIFALIGGFVCMHPMAGEGNEDSAEVVETYMPWSLKVEKILERESDKFDDISDFYSFGNTWEEIYPRISWFTFLIFVTGYLLIYPIFSRALAWRFVAIRGVASVLFFFFWIDKLLNTYALYSERGYFFLTDKGLLIVTQGEDKKSIWFAYEQIAEIEVLVHPYNLLPERYLRITDSGGGEKDYSYRLFSSIFVFRELYTQLIAVLKKSRALKHKSVENV